MEQDISTILNYGNDKTICYLSKVKMKTHHILTFRIGNQKFWREKNKLDNTIFEEKDDVVFFCETSSIKKLERLLSIRQPYA